MTMQNVSILYPSIAMFFLTISLLITLGLSRFLAIKTNKVSIKYYTKYIEGEQPERLHILGRHVQNHFEVPPLFHIGVILIFVTGTVTDVNLAAAWLFVAFRVVHTIIHLSSNNVSQRFFCFGLGLACLFTIWGSLLEALLTR